MKIERNRYLQKLINSRKNGLVKIIQALGVAVIPIEFKSDRRISGKCFDEYDNSGFNDNLSKTLKVLKRFNTKSVFIC